MATNLFIDTNVLLSFYHLTGEDLEELKKLSVLIEQKQIRLLVPKQVEHEFRRNREAKIADALKKLRDQKLNFQFPQLCKDYPEYSRLRALQKEYEGTHAQLLTQVTAHVNSETLKADQIISNLFDLGDSIATDAALVSQARLRMDLGNPPGKKSSLGDAINWEALLAHAPDTEALHFVTEDQDYGSPLAPASFNGFLLKEWHARKNGELVSYKRLSDFFKANFPDIKLASEVEKDLLIRDLGSSLSFAMTHLTVAKLRKFSEFTLAQTNAILSAAVTNPQVGSIIADHDVRDFLISVLEGKEHLLDSQTLSEVQEALQPHPDQEHDNPFL